MKHGSLFSGIGGFDLASEWCGWDNVFQCEIDQFCQKVLNYHFPNTELYEDIKKTDFKKYAGAVDVISGGFPCQPFSFAGKRKGTADNRFLWPEMLRAIREVKPSWVVAENVSGITSQEGGLVFERVCVDLENDGYEVQAIIIPACSVGAPHRRDRIWFVANSPNAGIENLQRERENGVCKSKNATNSESTRQQRECEHGQREIQSYRRDSSKVQAIFADFPTQSPICSRNDGFSYKLDGITFPKWRSESVKAYGNAIVPQVAYQIFSKINEFNKKFNNERVESKKTRCAGLLQ